ncbi:MAG: hypothetical protein M1134_04660 [Actinobacteria bacterium]|nr:hypothetical protein [Actinomycetota bacterium]
MKIYKPVAQGGVVGFDNTKPAFVLEDLNELHGPNSGVVQLPPYIDWTANTTYDLAKPSRVRTMYSTVLREAKSESDVADLICASLLVTTWRSLRLPEFLREAWEASHRELC